MCAINLLPPSPKAGAWSARRARTEARAVLEWARVNNCHLVLVGRRVEAAFLRASLGTWHDRRTRPWNETYWLQAGAWELRRCITVPHPSGRCRVWNEPGKFDEVREAVRKLYMGITAM